MRCHVCRGHHSGDVNGVDLTPICAASSETFTHSCSPDLTGAPHQTPMLLPTLSRCKTRKNPLPSAECFYGRLETIQGRGSDGIGPC